MKLKTKALIGTAVAGTLTMGSFIVKAQISSNETTIKDPEKMTVKEKEYQVNAKSIGEIEEINKKNIDLVVYESDKTDYSTSIKDEGLFLDIIVDAKTKFNFLVTMDLRKVELTKAKDKILVSINPLDIKLKTVSIDKPTLEYDTSILTRMQGQRLIDLESATITKVYDDINAECKKEFNLNQELYKKNLKYKLEKLYDCDNVIIIFEEGK